MRAARRRGRGCRRDRFCRRWRHRAGRGSVPAALRHGRAFRAARLRVHAEEARAEARRASRPSRTRSRNSGAQGLFQFAKSAREAGLGLGVCWRFTSSRGPRRSSRRSMPIRARSGAGGGCASAPSSSWHRRGRLPGASARSTDAWEWRAASARATACPGKETDGRDEILRGRSAHEAAAPRQRGTTSR